MKRKGIYQVKAEEIAERTVRFKISSEVVDRDGDILIAKGCDFTNFAKNPLFLPFHDYDEYPLGIPKNWGVEGDAVYSDVYFPTIEELSTDPTHASDKAKLVDFTYHCYKSGMLNAVSVGFLAKDVEPNKETGGYIVKEWELLEFSAVAIPANQDAIRQAVKSFGADGKSIIADKERIKMLEAQVDECVKAIKALTSDDDEIEIEEDDEEVNLDEIKNEG